jgi:alkylated DNA repair dioxygenase AlkB
MSALIEATTSRPFRSLDLPKAEVLFYPDFFPAADADRLVRELLETTDWRQEVFRMYGREMPFPRLTSCYGDDGTAYTYSSLNNTPALWTPPILEVKRAVEAPCGVTFNSVLLNHYRTGQDSVSWHADDEPEFGRNPIIASVSLGGTRVFQLKHKKRKELKSSVELTHGRLLIMRGGRQENWLHEIPKAKKPVQERVNLTFRVVVPPSKQALASRRGSSQRHGANCRSHGKIIPYLLPCPRLPQASSAYLGCSLPDAPRSDGLRSLHTGAGGKDVLVRGNG